VEAEVDMDKVHREIMDQDSTRMPKEGTMGTSSSHDELGEADV
jgi:hypothetical protein